METTRSAVSKPRPVRLRRATREPPLIAKWKEEVDAEDLDISILGTYTLTWYNEATPNERHTEQVTVTTEMIEPYGEEDFLENVIPYTFDTPTDGVYVVVASQKE